MLVFRHLGKSFFNLLLTGLMSLSLHANIPEELSKPIQTCYSTEINAARIAPDLIVKGDIANLSILISEWERFCAEDTTNFLLVTRILTDLSASREPRLNDAQFRQLVDYIFLPVGDDTVADTDSAEASSRRFITFVQEHSRKQIRINGERAHPLYFLLAEDLDQFFKLTRSSPQTPTAQLVTAYRHDIRRIGGWAAGLYSGIWQPLGKNRLLGTHPMFGGFLGWENYYAEIALNVHFRFGDSLNPYTVVVDGKPVSTSAFSGGYVGIDISFNFISGQKYDLRIGFGLGYDVFSKFIGSPNPQADGSGIDSGNLNLGPSFRYYLGENRSAYLLATARICLVYYKNEGGTDLSGLTSIFYVGFGYSWGHDRETLGKKVGGLLN